MLHEIDNTSRVTIFVVIPGNQLDKVGVEHDTGIGIKDGTAQVTFEISGHERLVGVSEEALHVALGLGLDVSADLLVGGGLLDTASQVNDRHINGGHTESHTGKLSNQGWNNLGHSLGGTSGGGDDVARGGTSSAPVLAGGGVNNSLGGGHGVDSSHQRLLNYKFIMDGLDHGGKSVSGTGGTRDEVLRTVVGLGVNTHDNGQRVILGRGTVDDLLGTTVDDGLGRFLGEEDSSGFTDVVSSEGTPADLLGVAAAGSLDLLSVQDKEIAIDLDGLLGLAVDSVVLVLVGHVVGGGRTGVDGVELAVVIFHHDTGHETSNTAKTVDSHASGHLQGGVVGDRALQRGSGE